jgi:hypothetical protein
MRITVEFESLEEFQKHITTGREKVEITAQGLTVTPAPILEPEEPREDAAHVSGMCPITTAEEAPAEAPVAIPWETPEEAVEAKAPAVTEDFRVEVRKTLAALNKQKTGNPAKALIAETGYKKLTDVPLELLPGLMEKAKEALNG